MGFDYTDPIATEVIARYQRRPSQLLQQRQRESRTLIQFTSMCGAILSTAVLLLVLVGCDASRPVPTIESTTMRPTPSPALVATTTTRPVPVRVSQGRVPPCAGGCEYTTTRPSPIVVDDGETFIPPTDTRRVPPRTTTTTRPPTTTTTPPPTTAPEPEPVPPPVTPPVEEVPNLPPIPDTPKLPAYYSNCAAARAAGAAPLRRGDEGYRSGLDRDGDGVACEK